MTENEAKVIKLINDISGDYKCFSRKLTHEESLTLDRLLVEIQQYRELGTVEDFKALKAKSLEKKPTYSDFDENEAGEIIPYKAVCPICGHEFEFGTWNDEENHHCVCGQKLDWSE